MRCYLLIVATLLMVGCAAGTVPRTVEKVDLRRYSGDWYEIASIPQWFQEGCVGSRATYKLRDDGKVEVVNQCRDGSFAGKVRMVKGTARSTNPPANSKLKVMFFWPFEGDYWVLRLDEGYTTAAVGSPNRKTLWILHRSPRMDEGQYRELVESLRADGFEVDRLRRTQQQVESP